MHSSRWDQPPPPEPRPELCALLPPELVLHVLTLGAYEHRHLAVTLLRVSEWTQALVQPLLFRTIHLRTHTLLPILRQIKLYLPPTFFRDKPVHTFVVDYGIKPEAAFESACARAHTLVVHVSLLPRVRKQTINNSEPHWLDGYAPRTIVVLGSGSKHRPIHVRWSAPCFARLERLVCTGRLPTFELEAALASLEHVAIPVELITRTPDYINELHKTRPGVHVTVYGHRALDSQRMFPVLTNVTRVYRCFELGSVDPWNPYPPFEGLFG